MAADIISKRQLKFEWLLANAKRQAEISVPGGLVHTASLAAAKEAEVVLREIERLKINALARAAEQSPARRREQHDKAA